MANGYSPYQAPLFRGATKSAMIFGVPLIPLVAFATPVIGLTGFFWRLIGYPSLLGIPLLLLGFFIMREMSKRDDQYLSMWLIELQERGMLSQNRSKNRIVLIPPTPLRGKRFIDDDLVG